MRRKYRRTQEEKRQLYWTIIQALVILANWGTFIFFMLLKLRTYVK